MLDMMERNNACVDHGHPIGDNSLWLDGPTVNNEFVSWVLDNQFSKQQMLLTNICVSSKRKDLSLML
jgi:hypothetical protein